MKELGMHSGMAPDYRLRLIDAITTFDPDRHNGNGQTMKPIQVSSVGPCRVRGAENCHSYLDLGHVPLANSFATDRSAPQRTFPFYRDEILANETDLLNAGGHFLIPIPEPDLVGAQGSTIRIGATA
jgi:hypothetical protein